LGEGVSEGKKKNRREGKEDDIERGRGSENGTCLVVILLGNGYMPSRN
jgi:hypothetical protein